MLRLKTLSILESKEALSVLPEGKTSDKHHQRAFLQHSLERQGICRSTDEGRRADSRWDKHRKGMQMAQDKNRGRKKGLPDGICSYSKMNKLNSKGRKNVSSWEAARKY